MARMGFLIAAVVVTALAALYDWRKGEYPNWLTLGTFLAALIAHTVVGVSVGGVKAGLWELGESAGAAALCAIVPGLLYYKKGMFGGDVKLLTALGALLGIMVGIEAELYAFVAAALYAPVRMAYEGKLLRTMGNTLALVFNPIVPKERRREVSSEMLTLMRFGPAAFVGTCVAVIVNWKGP